MKALLEALANILQFVIPALLITWADQPRKRSARSLQSVKTGDV